MLCSYCPWDEIPAGGVCSWAWKLVQQCVYWKYRELQNKYPIADLQNIAHEVLRRCSHDSAQFQLQTLNNVLLTALKEHLTAKAKPEPEPESEPAHRGAQLGCRGCPHAARYGPYQTEMDWTTTPGNGPVEEDSPLQRPTGPRFHRRHQRMRHAPMRERDTFDNSRRELERQYQPSQSPMQLLAAAARQMEEEKRQAGLKMKEASGNGKATDHNNTEAEKTCDMNVKPRKRLRKRKFLLRHDQDEAGQQVGYEPDQDSDDSSGDETVRARKVPGKTLCC